MKALVVYDTKFGNTEKVARAIAQELAGRYELRVIAADDLAALTVDSADLLVVGGPTQGHGMSPGLRRLLQPLERGELQGVEAATFDTRLDHARWLTGSAARTAEKRLHRAGCRIVAPAASFIVEGNEGPLRDGELERATAWAREEVADLVPVG